MCGIVGIVGPSAEARAPAMRRMRELLVERCGVADAVHALIQPTSAMLPRPELDDLLKRCDFMIAGVGI